MIDDLSDALIYTSREWEVWDIALLPTLPIKLDRWDSTYRGIWWSCKLECELNVFRVVVF